MRPFEDELQQQLTRLGTLQDQVDVLSEQIDGIKESIKTWMALNELEDYSVRDTNQVPWKIKISKYNRSSVDTDKLINLISEEDYNYVTKRSTIVKFTVSRPSTRKSKKSANTSSNGVPQAPIQNT